MSLSVIKVTVAKSDGSVDQYRVLPVTLVAFERQFGMGVARAMSEGRTEHLFWLAWEAEHHSGKVVKPFDQWIEGVLDVDTEDEPLPLGGDSSRSSLVE
jgi:hypothetical protein